ncbi:MAG: helix-turn-helix transcriptional regulator [Ferrovibrio sp.]|uniref:winged helix-turn-helix transcriptional regulator n=1 Tax=Ferrovibrio sp. TaxID=1917215 RepID=UPI00261EC2EA|nr:helix-turn-helix domain-containing protein [Ferrovibrio sp.]MCW0236069.1 helix-turn-helix transcriptional regulator [Ferrovibrio sp.]
MTTDSDLDFRHELTADGQPLCARMICATLDLIANKWAVPIILTLARSKGAPLRFSELSRAIPLITQKELTKQLRALETAGLVGRRVHAAVPPKVEYWLTDLGLSLRPVLDELGKWAARNGPRLRQPKQDSPQSEAAE